MTWNEFEWKQRPPELGTVNDIWKEVSITPVHDSLPAVERYVSEMRKCCVNGGALFAQFRIESNQDFDWYASRRQWTEIEFFTRLFSSCDVVRQVPDLVAGLKAEANDLFESCTVFTLDGELARNLIFGGAYENFQGSPREAKILGQEVCDSLFADRFLEIDRFHSASPWSSWFYDLIWDSTDVLIDRASRMVTILASTDTD